MNKEIRIASRGVELRGELIVPRGARALIIFAHGSGSSRHSPRNRAVAEALQRTGFATLLFDLLTAEEDDDNANRFDIALLASRLVDATRAMRNVASVAELPIGYFGASTGAAAALTAAAMLGDDIFAVVSRGGRPDLAMASLANVEAPVLLIVGGRDEKVLALNRAAQHRIGGHAELAVVDGATHLFEEPGALERVQTLACNWLAAQLRNHTAAAHGESVLA